jgi:glutathione S-transferase
MRLRRLTYFDMRGRAEAIRLFLHATQTGFEDHLVVSREEWAELKPRLPFGVLPVYETESGGLLCESHAILRHLGRVLTPAGRDEPSSTELDAAHDALAEAQEDLWRFNWRRSYYDHLESYARETLEPRLRLLERWFTRTERRSEQWVGASFSHVDCVAFCYLDEIDAFFPGVLAGFPELASLRSRVAALPALSGYLHSADRPIVFGMGRMGPKVDPRVELPAGRTYANPWTDPLDLAQALRGQRRLTTFDRPQTS